MKKITKQMSKRIKYSAGSLQCNIIQREVCRSSISLQFAVGYAYVRQLYNAEKSREIWLDLNFCVLHCNILWSTQCNALSNELQRKIWFHCSVHFNMLWSMNFAICNKEKNTRDLSLQYALKYALHFAMCDMQCKMKREIQ